MEVNQSMKFTECLCVPTQFWTLGHVSEAARISVLRVYVILEPLSQFASHGAQI